MANFNYGINCPTKKIAEKLFVAISVVELFQDGLDISDERVTVISNSSMKDEIKKFAKTIPDGLIVEIWPVDMEYDEAEETGNLETYEFEGKGPKKAEAGAPAKFKVYSGNADAVAEFKSWLSSLQPQAIIVSEWHPENDLGSHGIEFLYADPKFDKLINKDWVKKGVIAEKIK